MSNYADGVPLYLNKKFYPIPRTKYKEVDFHIPLDALQEGYEFTLEKQALAECEQYEKEKKIRQEKEAELRLKREEQAKANAEAAASKAVALVREYEEELAKQTKGNSSSRLEIVSSQAGVTTTNNIATTNTDTAVVNNKEVDSTTEDESPQVGSTTVYSPDDNSSSGATSGPTVNIRPETTYKQPPPLAHSQEQQLSYPPIIQPKPFNPYEPVRQIPRAIINLSDFESDTANPFDNVELNSINDMAVLATVLQNNVACSHNLNQSTSGSNSDHHHHHHQQQQQQQLSNANNINVSVNTMNGIISQPIHQYFPPPPTTTTYLSHSSQNPNSYNPHPHQWTPTTHNPFYSHFPSTVVTSAATTVSTSSSSDSMPNQSTLSSSLPIHRTGPSPINIENSTTILSTVSQQNNQQQQQLHPTPNPSSENFANFYFPYTSSQAQSRLKNHDPREFS